MNTSAIQKTKDFIKKAFIEHPHYSFNHRSVMYDHSVTVQELALQIADEVDCDRTIIAIAALLHDIGKTHQADSETLYKDHQNFNLLVSNEFLKSLELDDKMYQEICNIISYTSTNTEIKVVKDADALALCFDKMLYMLFIQRVYNNNLKDVIERKLDKYNNLFFEISKQLCKEKLEQMKYDWEDYKGKAINR